MSTVFITQIPARLDFGSWIPTVDVTPAKAFGEIHLMVPSGLNYPDGKMATQQLRKSLINFDPQTDYLLALGDPVLASVASALLAYEHGHFTLLKWDRQQRIYVPYKIEVQGNH